MLTFYKLYSCNVHFLQDSPAQGLSLHDALLRGSIDGVVVLISRSASSFKARALPFACAFAFWAWQRQDWSSRVRKQLSIDVLLVLGLTFSGGYTTTLGYEAFRADDSVIHEARLLLQCGLVTLQINQAAVGLKVFDLLEKPRWLLWPGIVYALALSTIILCSLRPSSKLPSEMGWAVCACNVLAECLNVGAFIWHTAHSTVNWYSQTTSARSSMAETSRKVLNSWRGLYLDLLLRLLSVCTTAFLGGFYVQTIWPVKTLQVLLCQSINLLIMSNEHFGTKQYLAATL
ncbi:hypothetical protein BST61_g5327 [Cercospora zeina]